MRYLFLSLCVAAHCYASGQSFPFIGPRANGVGYASACLSDEWAPFNNPAGIAAQEKSIASIAHDALPAIKTLGRSATVFAFPFFKGGMGVGAFRSGDDAYNEQMLSVCYGNTFGISSLGVSLRYIQYNAEGFGRKGVATISIGGITELGSWLTVGACVINVNQPRLDEYEKIPTILLIGAQLKVSPNVSALIEAEKNIISPPILKIGLEYTINKKFVFRTGLHPAPAAGFFGFGFHMTRLNFDYALSYNPAIGNRHQAGVSYKFRSQK